MSIDFEERLRADMGQVEVHPRPGLAREAHRRYQKGRRRNALAVAATGTAAAVAGATAGFALTSASPGTAPIRTTAYVVNRVSGALAATDAIGYSTSRLRGPGAPTVITGPIDTWQFGARARELIGTAAGQPATDLLWHAEGRSSVLTIIDYQNRTWTSTTIAPDQQLTPTDRNGLCSGDVQMLFGSDSKTAADWRHIIETGLKCGAFTVAGRQRVDGVDAIKLAGHKSVADTTIWVDPGSYLPVRLVSYGQVQRVGNGAGNRPTPLTLTVDFRWLTPTRANLAKLTAPIPAGFKQVRYPKQ
jgi:hypothetical protein